MNGTQAPGPLRACPPWVRKPPARLAPAPWVRGPPACLGPAPPGYASRRAASGSMGDNRTRTTDGLGTYPSLARLTLPTAAAVQE